MASPTLELRAEVKHSIEILDNMSLGKVVLYVLSVTRLIRQYDMKKRENLHGICGVDHEYTF